VTLPASDANIPLTPVQVKDLTMMCDPLEWPVPNMLAMINREKRDGGLPQCGVLVYAGMVGRYMFYEGLNFFMPKNEIQRFLANNPPRGPLLAYELEDLVREGWEVD